MAIRCDPNAKARAASPGELVFWFGAGEDGAALMREGKPSTTAAIVAFGRGVGLDDERRDKIAEELSPAPFGPVLGALGRTRGGRGLLRNAARVASLGLVDHAALRMHAVDDAVRDAADAGLSQLVVLGAGLDARPWRMEELSGTDVIEVDHPATQGYKRERIGERAALARSHRFAAVDFERDDLGTRLDQEGHDRARATHWLWEAVTMYLGLDAIDATLDEIGARSAPGSRLTLTYVTPRFVPLGRAPQLVTELAFRILGEPLRGSMTPDELRVRLARHGYRMIEDSSSREWAERHGGSTILPVAFRGERLAVAVRAT